MKIHSSKAEILDNIPLESGEFILIVENDSIASCSYPGQFVEIGIPEKWPLHTLRRPISIMFTENSKLAFLIKVRGELTKVLSGMSKGESIDITGPLGTPFQERKFILVGGGAGIAPLFFYAWRVPERVKRFIVGFRRSPGSVIISYLDKLKEGPDICTEDGSVGYRGTVIDFLSSFDTGALSADFLVCGPPAMLKKIKDILPEGRVYVSLEGMMGCGMGICMGCAVKKKGKEGYFRICREGPIFRLSDIVF